MRALLAILAAAALSIGAIAPAHAIQIGGMSNDQPGDLPGHGDAPCGVLDDCPSPELDPGGVAWDGYYYWVGNFSGSAAIYQVDPTTCTVVHSIEGPDPYIGGLAWDGNSLWCVPEQTGQIFQLDPSDGTVLSVINAPSYGQMDPDAAGLAWDGSHLWHADYGHDMIYKLDPTDGSVVASFPSPGAAPSGVGYAPGIVVVADNFTDEIYMLNSVDGSVMSSCSASDTRPWGIAVAGQEAWNAGADSDTLFLLDTHIVSPVETSTWGILKATYR